MLSPDRPRVSIGSMSPVTPPSTPVATPSPKAEREIRRSGKLLRQLKAVAGEGASTRHRNYDSTASLDAFCVEEGINSLNIDDGQGIEDISSIIDTDLYPIHLKKDDDRYIKLVANLRARFCQEGVVTLPGFLRLDVIPDIAKELEEKKGLAYETNTAHNIYLDQGNEDIFSSNHIRNRKFPTRVASLAYDNISHGNNLRKLYNNDNFRRFLRRILDLPVLYRLADPLGACSINIFKPGWSHAWHFDESNFSTTLMLQKAEMGGDFQHTQPIRAGLGAREKQRELCPNEIVSENWHYEMMENLVGPDGSSGGDEPPKMAKTLVFEPGTLSIFQGSQCLHRVTKSTGEKDRLVAVLCFSTRPGQKNSPQVQEMFWGRSVQ